MERSVCHFNPYNKDYHSIHTINFVYETSTPLKNLSPDTVYKMYYVCSGNAFLHTIGKITPLAEGDIFFTFPTCPYKIEPKNDFNYMYISFTGTRGNMILERLKINESSFIFHDNHAVYALWYQGLFFNSSLSDLTSESILLYTFSFLANRLPETNNKARQNDSVLIIKKYIDDNFTDPNFSISNMSAALSYNQKYISHIFKKHMNIGITEYLNVIRVQSACTLMKQGFTSISNISAKCGYSDSQYFSKVFKKATGLSPLAYITTLKDNNKQTF